ncbi:MAG: prolyl-tRNA synthetase associated domain-containing protein [Eubacteriales bacterium]|nr:prolyl-tRNA synthetase associated domain-containing protein [Eubacteriales bacterium]
MKIDQTLYSGRPAEKRSEQENAIYNRLDELGISFFRVDHEHADTMEDCLLIESVLGGKICKNLFLCNRQQTDFYLLLMPGDKPFKTKYLSAQLGCSRLSFADEKHMADLLHTIPGSVSALELLFDTEIKIRLLIDEELMSEETISGHPGFSTSTLRMMRTDLLKYIESTGHIPTIITLPVPEDE